MSTASTGAQPYEGFVQSDDVRIHFRAAGQGPLLLLVHGFPDNGETYECQMSELSKNYTVVSPSLRGFPPSDVPENADAYDLAKVALVGGHDFGAAAVQYLALFKPDLISGLILFNPPILPNLQKLVRYDEGQQKLSQYTIPFINFNKGDVRPEDLTTQFIREPARRQAIEEYLRTNPIHGMMAYYQRNYPRPPYGQKIEASPIQFQSPTLILWGSGDEYFSPKMVDGIPEIFGAGARLVTFPNAGHWPFRVEPEKVNRELVSWLAEVGHASK